VERLSEGDTSGQVTVKALPMLVPESVVQQDAEKKRVKRGILGGSEERFVFGKILYLPYLDFTYQYSTEKGFLAKQSVLVQENSGYEMEDVRRGTEPALQGRSGNVRVS